MDLEPFNRIDPCGFAELEVTDLRGIGIAAERNSIRDATQARLLEHLGLEATGTVTPD